METMSTHFHEHHDAILAWSWKLFCAKWARMTIQLAKLERERREREKERAQNERLQALRAQQQGLG